MNSMDDHSEDAGSSGHCRQAGARNVLADLGADPAAEVFTELARGQGALVERIVSTGQASPPGFWYDQAWDEWVLVLAGRAVLAFEDGPTFRLGVGECVMIPARCRHRVEWTDPTTPTVWLAVHFGRPGSS